MNQDDQLQQSLQALENGQALENIQDTQENELLRLASQIRGAQSPALNPLKVQAQRKRLLDSARAPRTGAVKPSYPAWLLPGGALGLAAFVLVSLLAFGLLVSNASAARSATLMDLSGVVEASSGADAAQWDIVNPGDKLAQGMHLRTRADSAATLVFYDGSRTTLGAQTEVVLRQVAGSWNPFSGRGLQVQFQQVSGETHHSVVPLKGSSSHFQVLTSAGTASVHGTIFDVAVQSSGLARFAVSRGVVAVDRVTLTAGQATVSQTDGQALPASFEFSAKGQISAIQGDQWTVGGLVVTVPASALGDYTFQVGDWVSLRGRILSDQSLVADIVKPLVHAGADLRFNGKVESIGAQSWVISGKTVLISAETEIASGIQVGDAVEVKFILQPDGSWLAKEIEKAENEDEEDQTPTPSASATVTPTGTLTLTATATPDETQTPTPTGTLATATPTPELTLTITPTATLQGNRAGCDGGMQQPEGARLAAAWGVSYQEIMSWFCQGFGFGEIDLAYQLAKETGKPVAEIFAMKSSGMGWGVIKQQLEGKPGKGNNKPTAAPAATKAPKGKNK